MSNYNLLQDKVAVVTGCNRGIGRQILDLFIANGAKVYAIARKDGSLCEYADNPLVDINYFDVTDNKSIKDLFIKIKKAEGRLDILVNNAGVMSDAVLGMINVESMENTFRTNVFSNIVMMQYASKIMVRQKSGSIVNLSSIMGVSGNAGQIIYSASKGAVIAMTKSAAKELSPNNIRVNAIAPGIIGTDMLYSVPEDKLSALKSKVAMEGRIGSPMDIAKAALFLASDLSDYISGQVLGVDGMMSN